MVAKRKRRSVQGKCRRCRRRFSRRTRSHANQDLCNPCRAVLATQERLRAHRVAEDAKPGETVADYLERRDRESWNM